MKNILVTGGMGYIGSHTVVELINNGYNPIIVDNLSNSKKSVLKRIEKITGKIPVFYEVDCCNEAELSKIFETNTIDAIIHFAGYKAVGESVKLPLMYYSNNLDSMLNIIKCMDKYNVKNLVFSSSATVYGEPQKMPISEDFPTGNCTNPYGKTKYMIEEILKDIAKADNSKNIALLRYFNPIGAHPSGLIGEDPNGIPNNLIPYVLRVASGKYPCVNVFGNDYNTSDGTGVRDYIHICDLAEGHISALKKLEEKSGLVIYNLGTGHGYSVLEVISAFSKACGHDIPYKFAPRRDGDIACCYAEPMKAEKELHWKCKRNLMDMAKDGWNWQKNNPDGYED